MQVADGIKIWLVLFCWAMACHRSTIHGQDLATGESSKLDAMVQVVLSEDTPMDIRKANASSLLQDPQAHPALVKILQNEAGITAKIVICQAIAASNGEPFGLNSLDHVPSVFNESLFQTLLADNAELASWAAQALVNCHDGVADKLAQMVLDTSRSPKHRLACINALRLIPGKQSVLAMADILDDQIPQINQHAAEALAEMLYLPKPLDIDQFHQYLPQLRTMDQETFLRWQFDQQEKQLRRNRLDMLQWQKWYINAQTEKFQSLSKPEEKLQFLKEFLDASQNQVLRIWAIEQMSLWSNAASVRSGEIAGNLIDLIANLISDDNSDVRTITAEILAKLNFEKARSTAPALLEQLKKENNPKTQAAILAALGIFESAESLERAIYLLDKSTQPEVVAQAARAVGQICAARYENITATQIEQITSYLALSYPKWSESVKIRSYLIQAMKKIDEQGKYHPKAIEHFKDILENALNDPEPVIRSGATYALTQLLGSQVLPLLLTEHENLINDKDNSVRSAVIAAIEKFGGKNQLDLLRQRLLDQETDPDEILLIHAAFTKILKSLPIDEIYYRTAQFQVISDKDQLLRQEMVQLLTDRITRDKADGADVKSEYEVFAFAMQAEIAQQKKQPDRALECYKNILNLKLPEEHKDQYRQKILALVLEPSQDASLLAAAKPLLLNLPARSAGALDLIAQACDQLDLENDQQLLRCADIVATLVVPIAQYPSEQPQTIRQHWKQRIVKIALTLIERHEKLLPNETGKTNAWTIDLLQRLNPKLTNYPFDGSLEQRRDKLQEFRRILQPPETETVSQPATEPAEQPKTTD